MSFSCAVPPEFTSQAINRFFVTVHPELNSWLLVLSLPDRSDAAGRGVLGAGHEEAALSKYLDRINGNLRLSFAVSSTA